MAIHPSRLPPGWRWVRRYPSDPWFMELMHGDAVRASVRLSPCKESPYSLAYTNIGSWRMAGNTYPTRMAAIRTCERWAAEFEQGRPGDHTPQP